MVGLCGGGAAGSARLPLCSGSWVLSRAPGCDGRQRAWVERVTHGGGSGSRRPPGGGGERGCGGLVPLAPSLERRARGLGCCGVLQGCPWVLQVARGDEEQRDPRVPCLWPLRVGVPWSSLSLGKAIYQQHTKPFPSWQALR